ncbi:MAG: hypothetical protein RLZZ196_1082 [Bacteroidota bacterium]|jgi:hypothetical protein
MTMEWQELIEFLGKQILIFIVFMCGLIIGYAYGIRNGGGF